MSILNRRLGILLLTCSLGTLQAQNNSGKLIFVIPNAVDAHPQLGVSLKDTDPFRSADFGTVVGSDSNFGPVAGGLMRPFNIGIATQLSALPIASPASGVIFREDPATGASLPSAQSLGPILTERAETIGKRRFYMGFTRQQFRFSKLEGQPLGNIHALDVGGVGTKILQDGVRQTTSPTTADLQIDLRLDQNVAFFTYGLTNRLDVSAALTWVNATVGAVASNGRIVNTGDPTAGGTCWCAQTFNVDSSRNTFGQDFGQSGFVASGPFGRSHRTSTGIGDTLIRVKGTVFERPSAAFALGADFRLPTGDELNYHGSGSAGFKPFAALSLHSRDLGIVRISPHFNIGYQVNGKSLLAGDIFTNTKGDLPNIFSWSAGAGISFSQRITFQADILGQTLLDANRLVLTTVPGRGQNIAPATGVTLSPNKKNIQMNSGAFGFKLKLAGNLVFSANMLVAFDDNGLRDRVVPLFGLGYTF
ncbi:MAG: hypothetical protein IT167_00010 [Bryobacterales bacterium]|nr:hypothetical protein [Bryobacterales bacterium]